MDRVELAAAVDNVIVEADPIRARTAAVTLFTRRDCETARSNAVV